MPRLLLAALVAVPAPLLAQTTASPPLEFLGFRPGSAGAEAAARARALGGTWECTAAAAEPRLAECRGTLASPEDGALTLRAALVDGAVAVLLIAGPVGEPGVARWREGLTTRYGSVTARREHGQESWQWIRRGQMIRLTTRREGATRFASVSLVDGALLDSLDPPHAPRRDGPA